MSGTPRCSIVIPHLAGSRPLLATLHALARVSIDLEVVLVDNASSDDSVEEAEALFPSLRVIHSATNLGYAGGANLGLEHVSARWCVFLNDDAVPAPGAIEALVERLESSPEDDLPLLQPVLRSSGVPCRFDYAGGAGGLIDRWGYPFALGRVFDQVEIDDGQYNQAGPLAWASGCCLAGPTALFRDLDGFEASFFAHFEEIDLCWRHRTAGGRIESVSGAIVYHMGPSTLPVGGLKTYLNFRNNWWTMRRNLTGARLLKSMMIRTVLDLLAALRWLVTGQPTMAVASARGIAAGIFRRPWQRPVEELKARSDRPEWGTLQGSIVTARYLRGVRSSRDLVGRITGWGRRELVENGS